MTCKLGRQMGTDENASDSSPEHHHDNNDDVSDDGDDDDKPRLRPLQSVALCSLSSPTQEPVSPIKNQGAATVV